jgi:signal transduction histidine kinase/ligand-binding sensor domain-containing protein
MQAAGLRVRGGLGGRPGLAVISLLLGLGLQWSGPVGWGRDLSASVSGCAIQNWQLEEGLPGLSITSIAQTPDGYLWLGTFNGLARFDGPNFTVFDAGNTPALSSGGIMRLAVDDEGALWMVTTEGELVRRAAGQFTLITREDALLPRGSICFVHDLAGRLLLRDRTGQVRRIRNGRLLPLGQADPFRTEEKPSLLNDDQGGTWIGKGGQVTWSGQATFPVFTGSDPGGPETNLVVDAATRSRSGGYWLTTTNGLFRLHQGKLSSRFAPLPPGVTQLKFLNEDKQSNVWAGVWGKGVYRWSAQDSWLAFTAGAGLADHHVNCFFRDREGSLWVGTGQGGLHRFRSQAFQLYDTEEGPGSNVVTSVTQDRQGKMWFGVNGGGLHKWEGGKLLTAVKEPTQLSSNSYALTYSVLADREGAVWIGLYGKRALRRLGNSVTEYDLTDDPSKLMTPHALLEDRAGAIWLGCSGSLMRYKNGHFTRYTTREGLSCDSVAALAEDQAGTLYIATEGGGLNALRAGRFTVATKADGLADNFLSSLYVDRENTLWIGTLYGGLSRFRNGRYRTISVNDGLPAARIGTLIEDDSGYLWFGSNRGIVRVSRQALNDFLDGKGPAIAWRVFGLADGLSTIGCISGNQPAACKAQDGKLWFATVKGVAVVDPKNLPSNPLPPPVVIEQVVLDDRAHDLANAGATFTVPPRSHRLEFHFAGLSLEAPEHVRYRYRLDPFDNDWIQPGTRRVAYYTRVPPGRYQLRVTACNNDGVWNETGASLALVVLPPWWMTWWFRALILLGMLGLVFGSYEWRIHHLRRERLAQESFSRRLLGMQENERQRIAGELHDGMGQDLLVIASQAQLGLTQEEDRPATVARLKDIAETAKQALHQARRMAHNLRPGLIEELGFTKALRATLEKAAQASSLSLAMDLTDVDGLLPPEFEVNLFRVSQECLNNVLKHAGASEAKVTLRRESAGLRLVVEDNGRGFNLDRMKSGPPDQMGFGLRQIAERTKMMAGRIDIQSRPGKGTRIIVEVPVKDSRN